MNREFFKRPIVWVGGGTIVTLAVMLVMQYQWLVALQQSSAIAQKATLDNYIESVSDKVEYYYRRQAERTLNLPESIALAADADRAIQYFRKREAEGAKLLFVCFADEGWSQIHLYDPSTDVFGKPAKAEMTQAIDMAVAPWRTLRGSASTTQSWGLTVEERDPTNRIVVNPIAGDDGRILGVAGMIVDEGFFLQHVLPEAVGKSLAPFSDGTSWDQILIVVRDGSGRQMYGNPEGLESYLHVHGRLRFVFSDWSILLGRRGETPEQWARSHFVGNVTFSALLAVTVLVGVVFAFRSATQAQRLSEMKSEFVSNVSHELRTPLASMRVFGELMRLDRVRDPSKIREYGRYIETQGRRLTGLIDNILDFSRIESGARSYRLEPTDLASLVRETLDSLRLDLEQREIRLVFEPPPDDFPATLRVDADGIARALTNLIDNAAKHSSSSAEVRVKLDCVGPEVRLSVADHGSGIPPHEHRRIFERFHRVGSGLVHDVRGSGLGLSIVDHVVRAHGGRVELESVVGRGSTFTICLPLDRPTGSTSPLPRGDADATNTDR